MAEQPKFSGGRPPASGKGSSGLSASQRRLAALNFDPMQQMVDTYRRLEGEITYQEGLRDGSIVELNAKGNAKAFYPDHLYALYDKLANISDKLLRYGYGRVSETTILATDSKSPLVINLSGGRKKVVNASPEVPEDD